MQIEKDIAEWHKETFPNATQGAILGKVREEAGELLDATYRGTIIEVLEEFADVFITISAFISRSEINWLSLEDIIEAKLNVNKKRQWGKETENGDRPRVK